MSLLDDVETEARRDTALARAKKCDVIVAAEALADDDAAKLLDLVYDETLTGAALGRHLEARGISVSGSTINRHRLGSCKWCNQTGATDG